MRLFLEVSIILFLAASVAVARKENAKIVRPDTTISMKPDTTISWDTLFITRTYRDTAILIKSDTLPLTPAKTKKKVKL